MAKRRPAGDGMVRKREDGRWEGRIVVGHKSNGDSIFRYISAPTQKELSAKLRQLTEAYKGVDLTEESNMALSVWLDKWLDEYMAATLRPTTLNGYRRSLELHVKPYLGKRGGLIHDDHVLQDHFQLGNAGIELALLVLCLIILAVFAEVAEAAGDLDLLRHLVGPGGLQIIQFLLKFLSARCAHFIFSFHTAVPFVYRCLVKYTASPHTIHLIYHSLLL